MAKSKWEVIVTNLGTVYTCYSGLNARGIYNDYVTISKAPHGRGAGENVTLMCDNEPVVEYIGTLEMPEPTLDAAKTYFEGEF